MKTLLIFIDGLGWGLPDAELNPQYSYGGQYFRFPAYEGSPVPRQGDGWAVPIDAVLDVQGVPQSATGQTTLFSGVSAQGALGKHLTGFPNLKLQEILRRHSVLKTLTDRCYQARFLNAFRPRFWELSEEKKWTLSASTVATLAAGVPFFDLEDLKAGRSVYQEFTNAELIERGFDVQPMTPQQAGEIIGRRSSAYDFTMFEYCQSDKAGHSADTGSIEHHLSMLEAFLRAVLVEVDDMTLVLVSSDHGNLEDTSTRRHTTNPVPLMAWGKGAMDFVAGVQRLDEVVPRILQRHPPQ